MLQIIEFIKKLFCKKNILRISPPKENIIEEHKNEIENTEKNFALELKRSANPSINDGNGFGIVKYINLKENI